MFFPLYKTDKLLSTFTSIKLGGRASYFFRANNLWSLCLALKKAKLKGIPVFIIGEGSNLVISDDGFDGLVIKLELRGIKIIKSEKACRVRAAAGENWDAFVKKLITNSFGGLECLSGIPGSVGASPIQNIGAYGQEVASCIESVECLDRKSLEIVKLSHDECRFNYRSSIFKKDLTSLIITHVNYCFDKEYMPEIIYPQLRVDLEQRGIQIISCSTKALESIRASVLALRTKKGLVIGAKDSYLPSVGSFFVNPILTNLEYAELTKRCLNLGIKEEVPFFTIEKTKKKKVPAAWLIEKAGFSRGFSKYGVGISPKHALVLVNNGDGTTKALLSLAKAIKKKLQDSYGITLKKEPVVL